MGLHIQTVNKIDNFIDAGNIYNQVARTDRNRVYLNELKDQVYFSCLCNLDERASEIE